MQSRHFLMLISILLLVISSQLGFTEEGLTAGIMAALVMAAVMSGNAK
jgi:hypothetical protein